MVRDAGAGARGAAASKEPQKGHARAPSGVVSPHCGQCVMGPNVAGWGARGSYPEKVARGDGARG